MRDHLQDLDADLTGARPGESAWRGVAADRARAGHDGLAERLRRVVAGTTAVRVVLAETADAVVALSAELRRADDLAAQRGFRIGPDGTITDADPSTSPSAQVATDQRQRTADRDEIAGILGSVLSRAKEVDGRLRTTLERAAAEQIDDGTGATLSGAAITGTGADPAEPPPGASPQQNAAWWRGLSPAGQERMLVEHPEMLGNLDGVPAEVRDEANRARFPEVAAQVNANLTAAEARLHTELAEHPQGRGLSDQQRALREQVDHLRDQQAALASISQAAAPPGRQLLLLDVDGHATPRAAVAIGDVDTARHVGVFTPGFTTTVSGGLAGYTSDMGGVQDSAKRLLRQKGRTDEQVATVAWLGYDAPQWNTVAEPGRSVLTESNARAGGDDLARFYDGINASRPGSTPHMTALGHSYGSTTTGYALQHTTTPVDDAVVFGSPGLTTDHVSDLHVPAGHTAVIEARDDPIADTGLFGPDPNQMPDTTQLESQETTAPDGTPLRGSTGHSEYLEPDTTSQYNIAATVAGLPDARVTGADVGVGDVIRDPLGGPRSPWS